MPDLYTLTSVWRKSNGERRISTSTRTLEEFVEPFVNLAKGWNLQRVSAPSPVPVNRSKSTPGMSTRDSPLSSTAP